MRLSFVAQIPVVAETDTDATAQGFAARRIEAAIGIRRVIERYIPLGELHLRLYDRPAAEYKVVPHLQRSEEAESVRLQPLAFMTNMLPLPV